MPWFMALFRNSIFAGSTTMLTSGRRPRVTINGGDNRTGAEDADDGKYGAQDAGGEGVHQHLEALAYLAFDKAVEPLDQEPAERPHDQRAEEHRYVAPDYDAHGGYRPDDAAARIVDYPTAGVADEEWQQVEDHGLNQRRQPLVRYPTVRDKHRRDQTPCDERRDVGHDHAAKEAAEPLNPYPEARATRARLTARGTCLSHGPPSRSLSI
jgi:hypothetical protein